MSNRRVVITGTGIITALGTGVEKNWKAMLAGTSGVGPITRFDASGIDARIAAEVKDFVPEEWIDRREVRRMDLYAQYALAATEMAMKESGLPVGQDKPHGYVPEKVGVIIGSGIGGLGSLEEQHKKALEKGFDRLSPFFILQMIINMAPGLVTIKYGCKGPNWSPVSACSTSAHAIGEAVKSIRIGETDAMIAGGAEAAITPLGIGGFAAMKALSTRNDDPAGASRPFDKDRDGFVEGEGAGILVLEELEHARRRGANILAEIVGYGMTGDAHHITAPHPEGTGSILAFREALRDGGILASEVDYINVHGTSTQLNDKTETRVVKEVLGDHARKVSLSSTKSMTGHMIGAAAAVESVATVLAIRTGIVPPTINYEEPDPECDLDITPNVAKEKPIRYALKNSLGFGGHNAAILFKRWEG